MARLTKQQWSDARKVWELDPREGHQWLADDLIGKGFDVNRVAIAKAAKRQEWAKVTQGEKVTESVTQKVTQSDKKSLKKVTTKKTKTVPVITDAVWEEVDEKTERLHGNSLYKHEYAEQVYKLCLLSATDVEIADFFRVSEQTINNWKHGYPDFLESLHRGKLMADANVTDRLYQRAMGYSHADEKIFNNMGEIVRAETIKHYPPDTGAIKLWLFNRRPKDWKANVEAPIEINLNVFPAKEVLDGIYEKALEEAAKRDQKLIGRRERLGILIEHD